MSEYKYVVNIDTPSTIESKKELTDFLDPLIEAEECRPNTLYYNPRIIYRPGYAYMFWFKSKNVAQTLVEKYGIFAGVKEVE